MGTTLRLLATAGVFGAGLLSMGVAFAQTSPPSTPNQPNYVPGTGTGAAASTAKGDRAKIQHLDRELRGDRHDLRDDRRDLQQDRTDIREDQQQLRQADRQWMQDDRTYQRDLATGNKAGARAERKVMEGDQAAANQDMRNLEKQQRVLGKDGAELW